MIIDGNEYKVRLYVEDVSTSELLADETFDDFQAMNDFINATEDDYEYDDDRLDGVDAWFEIVESIDGKPRRNTVNLTSIVYMELMDEEIEDAIAEFKEYQEEQELRRHFTLCKECREALGKGDASAEPVLIMAEVVRNLDIRGYRISSACAGHLKERYAFFHISVGFQEPYTLPRSLPEGFGYSKVTGTIGYTGDLYAIISKYPVEVDETREALPIQKRLEWKEFGDLQIKKLKELLAWSESLPERVI